MGKGCRRFTGSAWDPTHQCIPWSGSPHCDDGKLCGDESYEYECLWDEDRYSCAPGDISGKIGSLPVGGAIDIVVPNIPLLTTLLPETEALTDKVMAIMCTPDGEKRPQFIACAPIEEYEEDVCRDCWEAMCLWNGEDNNFLPQCGTGDPFELCQEEEFIEIVQMEGVRLRLHEDKEVDELVVCSMISIRK